MPKREASLGESLWGMGEVQATGCASVALWQAQLHGITSEPTGQADARGWRTFLPSPPHHFSLLEVTSAGC